MKTCYFDQYHVEPDYKDVETLKKFVTPRGKILSPEKSGVCAKHQRSLSKHIKYARQLALIAYTSYQQDKLKINST